MATIIELKSELRRNWQVIRDENQPEADRRAAAENIVDLQEKITELDKSFNPINLADTQYKSLLSPKTKTETETKMPETPSIKQNEIPELCQKVRQIFETKRLVEYIAKTEFPEYNNGASVGQVLGFLLQVKN